MLGLWNTWWFFFFQHNQWFCTSIKGRTQTISGQSPHSTSYPQIFRTLPCTGCVFILIHYVYVLNKVLNYIHPYKVLNVWNFIKNPYGFSPDDSCTVNAFVCSLLSPSVCYSLAQYTKTTQFELFFCLFLLMFYK